jgi:hypothetical protein
MEPAGQRTEAVACARYVLVRRHDLRRPDLSGCRRSRWVSNEPGRDPLNHKTFDEHLEIGPRFLLAAMVRPFSVLNSAWYG